MEDFEFEFDIEEVLEHLEGLNVIVSFLRTIIFGLLGISCFNVTTSPGRK